MGCVQQAVLEFDGEVRAPWRPRLVPDAGADLLRVRPPSHRTQSRVGVCAPPDPPRAPARARRHDSGQASQAAIASNPPMRRSRGRAGSTVRSGRVRLRLTRRARRLAFVLAVVGGVVLGVWLAPHLGGEGRLRLAGESSVVVQHGDTLWSIAAAVSGDDDVRAVVDEIQRLNGLRGSELVPGQVLDLP